MNNKCPRCDHAASPVSPRLVKHAWMDSFKCTSDFCGAEFVETGTGPEFLPGAFLVSETYQIAVMFDVFKRLLTLTILSNHDGVIKARVEVGGSFYFDTFEVSLLGAVTGDVEVLHIGRGISGQAIDVLPYNIVFDKEEIA